MAFVQGYFKEDTPQFNVRVWGADSNSALELEAVMDTGFNGFLLIPSHYAPQMGLTAETTTVVTQADGREKPSLVAQGYAALEDESRSGLIILEDEGNEVLAGMGFIRAFGLSLIINPSLFLMTSTTGPAESQLEPVAVEIQK